MAEVKEIAARRQELVAALSVLLPDDDLFALIERADQSDDSVAVLQAAYDDASVVGGEVEKLMVRYGLAIVPVTSKKLQPNSREVVEVTVGYELERDTGERKLYAGKTLSFGPRYKAIPFATIDDAKQAAVVWVDLQNENGNYPATIRRVVRIPIALGMPTPKNASQVSWKMSVEETANMDAILRGLRADNCEFAEGKPVDSYIDVMRWLMRKLFT